MVKNVKVKCVEETFTYGLPGWDIISPEDKYKILNFFRSLEIPRCRI